MVYFIEGPDGRVKIGWSGRLGARLAALMAREDCELRILGVVDGAYEEEQGLHRRFAALRISPRGEWFEPGAELLAFIAEHARPWDGPVEADPDAQGGRLVRVQVRCDVVHDAKAAARLRRVLLCDYVSEAIRRATERDLGELS